MPFSDTKLEDRSAFSHVFACIFLLKDFEASFIRLLDKLTNGSRIEVNETGKTCVTQALAFMNHPASIYSDDKLNTGINFVFRFNFVIHSPVHTCSYHACRPI